MRRYDPDEANFRYHKHIKATLKGGGKKKKKKRKEKEEETKEKETTKPRDDRRTIRNNSPPPPTPIWVFNDEDDAVSERTCQTQCNSNTTTHMTK